MSSPPYPGPTAPMIGALLRLAADRAHALLYARLREAGYSDLRPAHFALFQFPGPHGVRPVELAARLGLPKQALTPLLNDLERAGYLERRPAQGDGRGRVLWLTPRGLAFMGTSKALVAGIEAEWSARLGADRFATLKAALQELTEGPD
ncbi:MAG TPA: MarR family winged helix-turn-helix transcriptional regulator [Thermomicrobiales bacterium]|nr:MarR family winged helix-turn-helix transcriptional regulator [Thermomicrobiales bacterium]